MSGNPPVPPAPNVVMKSNSGTYSPRAGTGSPPRAPMPPRSPAPPVPGSGSNNNTGNNNSTSQQSSLQRSPSMPSLSPPRTAAALPAGAPPATAGTAATGSSATTSGGTLQRQNSLGNVNNNINTNNLSGSGSGTFGGGGGGQQSTATRPGTPNSAAKKAPAVPMTRPAGKMPTSSSSGTFSPSNSVPNFTQQTGPSLQHSVSAPSYVTPADFQTPRPQQQQQQQQQQQAAPSLPSPRKAPPPPPPPKNNSPPRSSSVNNNFNGQTPVPVATAPAPLTPAALAANNSIALAASTSGQYGNSVRGRSDSVNSRQSIATSSVPVPAVPLNRPGGLSPNQQQHHTLAGSANAVLAANRLRGGLEQPSMQSGVFTSPPRPTVGAAAAGGGMATSPNSRRDSVHSTQLPIPAAPPVPPSPSRSKSVPPPPSVPGTSQGHNDGIQPYRVTPSLVEIQEQRRYTSPVPPPPPPRSEGGRTVTPQQLQARQQIGQQQQQYQRTGSANNNNNSNNFELEREDMQFEIRLLRQKVGALEGEVTFLRRELEAARNSPYRVRRTGSSSGAGGGENNNNNGSQEQQQQQQPRPLSYSMQDYMANKDRDGLTIEQRLASLQDLQYHMTAAKAIADNVHITHLSSPRADSFVPPRHLTSLNHSPLQRADAVTYSPTQQQMMENAVREAQRALAEPAAPLMNSRNYYQSPWQAAAYMPAPLSSDRRFPRRFE